MKNAIIALVSIIVLSGCSSYLNAQGTTPSAYGYAYTPDTDPVTLAIGCMTAKHQAAYITSECQYSADSSEADCPGGGSLPALEYRLQEDGTIKVSGTYQAGNDAVVTVGSSVYFAWAHPSVPNDSCDVSGTTVTYTFYKTQGEELNDALVQMNAQFQPNPY